MGKPTGFLEYQRLSEAYEPVEQAPEALQGVRRPPHRRAGVGPGRALHGLRHPVLQQRLPGQQHHSRTGTTWCIAATGSEAIEVLHSTNNFPEFTGRICPAPCEAACTLNINTDAGGHQVDRARDHRQGLGRMGWVVPQPAARRPARRSPSSAPARPGWPPRSNWRAPATTSPCSRRTTASAACCATASPTSRWRSR
jgi:glutamate synthase (NADPH/NADH) small chain